MDDKTAAQLPIPELLAKLSSTPSGLTPAQARDFLTRFGNNTLREDRNNAFNILIRQFRSSLIYLLLVASIISIFLADYSDALVIVVILLLNTTLGFVQEYHSERTVQGLAKLISKKVVVRRDSVSDLIDESQVVPGDALLLAEGDNVPADARILESEDLQVNESQLTGESIPIEKSALSLGAKSYQLNILYAGSTIEKGEVTAVVFATGKSSQLGNIAKLSHDTKKISQYEKSLQRFSNLIIKITLTTLVGVFLAKVIITGNLVAIPVLLLFIVGLAVTVVPEALPVIATLTLSRGALKLARSHVVAKRLSAIEDLGNINVLCSDKTGTLTENKLSVTALSSPNPDFFQKLALACVGDTKWHGKKILNSFDEAIVSFVSPSLKEQSKVFIKVKDLPFDPAARRSRYVILDEVSKKHYLVSSGSPETLLTISSGVHQGDYRKEISKDGSLGIRHFGISYREIVYQEDFDILKNEHSLLFLGMFKLTDPLRPRAAETILLAQKLGVAVKILSGDSREVAQYIGQEVGLIKDGDQVLIGDEFESLSLSEQRQAVFTNNVFARVTPQQKYNIIKLLKESNVVGYQGDGINDAPSLKLADVGIAVNSATDVAKDSAEIILLKKDIEVIINGIKDGREVFANISKYIRYTMVGNFGNLFALSALYLLSAELPLLTVQLLLTGLITDLPLLAVSTDTVSTVEVQSPQHYDMKSLVLLSLILGSVTGLVELVFFSITKMRVAGSTQTSLFLFLTIAQLVVIFTIRNKDHFWKALFPSKTLILSVLSIFVIAVTLPYLTFSEHIFHFTPVPLGELGIIALVILIYIFILDYGKYWYYKGLQKV